MFVRLLRSSAIYSMGVAMVSLGRQLVLIPVLAAGSVEGFAAFAGAILFYDLAYNVAGGAFGDYFYKLGAGSLQEFLGRYLYIFLIVSIVFVFALGVVFSVEPFVVFIVLITAIIAGLNGVVNKHLYLVRGFGLSIAFNGIRALPALLVAGYVLLFDINDVFLTFLLIVLASELAIYLYCRKFCSLIVFEPRNSSGFLVFFLSVLEVILISRSEVYISRFSYEVEYTQIFMLSSVCMMFLMPFTMMFSVTLASELAGVSDERLLIRCLECLKLGFFVCVGFGGIAYFAGSYVFKWLFPSGSYSLAFALPEIVSLWVIGGCLFIVAKTVLNRILDEKVLLFMFVVMLLILALPAMFLASSDYLVYSAIAKSALFLFVCFYAWRGVSGVNS